MGWNYDACWAKKWATKISGLQPRRYLLSLRGLGKLCWAKWIDSTAATSNLTTWKLEAWWQAMHPAHFLRGSRSLSNLSSQSILAARHTHMLTAKRLMGKLLSLVLVRVVFAYFCSGFKAWRIFLVFLGRKSSGTYFLPLYIFRASAFCFWLYTVRIRAIPFLTPLIFANLEAAPPETLATRSWDNSAFISSNSLRSSLDVLFLNS